MCFKSIDLPFSSFIALCVCPYPDSYSSVLHAAGPDGLYFGGWMPFFTQCAGDAVTGETQAQGPSGGGAKRS